MPHSFTDEAIVLRTYNVGETDRFCVLLTKHHGKIVARAQGVRRLQTRRGSGLLPLHQTSLTLEKHSFGFVIKHAECLSAFEGAWSDPVAFSTAMRGVELLVKLIQDDAPLEDVYTLTLDFLSACHRSHGAEFPMALAPLFSLQLLDVLGLLPAVHVSCVSHVRLSEDHIVFSPTRGGFCTLHEDPSGQRLSSAVYHILLSLHRCALLNVRPCALSIVDELDRLVQGFVGSQLGSSLVAPLVSLAISSGVTPICQ